MSSDYGTTKYLSFKASKYTSGPTKVGFESLASTGQVITITTGEAFNSNCKPFSTSILPTNKGCNNQAGAGYTVTTYTPKQYDAHPIDTRTLPVSNITSQHISVSRSTPFAHQTTLTHHPIGGVALASSLPLAPTKTAFVGTTDLRNAPEPSKGPAQLTIFYAGSVCVYNDVSPEKAQAIMLLAGNGNTPKTPPSKAVSPPPPPNKPTPSPPPPPPRLPPIAVEAPVQRPPCVIDSYVSNQISLQTSASRVAAITSPVSLSAPRPPSAKDGIFAKDIRKTTQSSSCLSFASPNTVTSLSSGGSSGFVVNESRRTAPSSRPNFTSAIPITSLSSGRSTEVTAARSSATVAPPASKPEPSPTAVPQARKASLARFLEKRKERTISVAPYPVKQSQDCNTLGSEAMSFSISSGSSFSISSIK